MLRTKHPILVIGLCIAATHFSRVGKSAEADGIEVKNAILKVIEVTNIAAEVTGILDQVEVQEGVTLRKDQSIGKIRDDAVRLDAKQTQLAMGIARKKRDSDINLRLAKSKQMVANNELERAEAANEKIANTYPSKEIDRLRLIATSSRLEVERAEHDMQLAALDVMVAENEYQQASELLGRHHIRSPTNGTVVSLFKRPGEWVEAGTDILQIVRTGRLRIEGFISVSDIDQPLVGCTATVKIQKGEQAVDVEGEVVFVSPDANPVNGNVRVYLEIDNSENQFRPGLRVSASIHRGTDK